MSLAVGQAVAEGISSNQEQPQPKLSVENLMISYENHKSGETTEAVHNVSLDIKPGEFVTIVGLSGCGKSSFLNAVAGLLKRLAERSG